jgi:hypothetical protein
VKEELNSKAFEDDLADLTFLETQTFVSKSQKMRTENEPELKSSLSSIWDDVLKRSTLRKAEASPTIESDSECWKIRSKRQMAFIRFD